MFKKFKTVKCEDNISEKLNTDEQLDPVKNLYPLRPTAASVLEREMQCSSEIDIQDGFKLDISTGLSPRLIMGHSWSLNNMIYRFSSTFGGDNGLLVAGQTSNGSLDIQAIKKFNNINECRSVLRYSPDCMTRNINIGSPIVIFEYERGGYDYVTEFKRTQGGMMKMGEYQFNYTQQFKNLLFNNLNVIGSMGLAYTVDMNKFRLQPIIKCDYNENKLYVTKSGPHIKFIHNIKPHNKINFINEISYDSSNEKTTNTVGMDLNTNIGSAKLRWLPWQKAEASFNFKITQMATLNIVSTMNWNHKPSMSLMGEPELPHRIGVGLTIGGMQ